MGDAFIFFIYGLTVVGCLAVGAWLAHDGSPFLALMAILIGGSLHYKSD